MIERRRRPRACQPSAAHLELARWLLAQEIGASQAGTLGVPAAGERACQKLLDRLARVITPQGCQALVYRAMYLAQTDFAFLRKIDPTQVAPTYVEGLGKHTDGADIDLVQRGVVCLLGTLTELMALFVGDHLTARLLTDVWPEVPTFALASSLEMEAAPPVGAPR